MISGYSLCSYCGTLLKDRDSKGWYSKGWDSVDGQSCWVDRHHAPADPTTYRSHKYGNDIRTAILAEMGSRGYESDSIGSTEDFGYFEYFSDAAAIVQYDSQGSVYSTVYETPEMASAAWSHVVADYVEFCDDEEEEDYYDTTDESWIDEYESDLWDCL